MALMSCILTLAVNKHGGTAHAHKQPSLSISDTHQELRIPLIAASDTDLTLLKKKAKKKRKEKISPGNGRVTLDNELPLV